MDLQKLHAEFEAGARLPTVIVTNVINLREKNYNGYYELNHNNNLHRLQGLANFIVIGNNVVGKGVDNIIHPLFNMEGEILILKGESKVTVKLEEASFYFIFRRYVYHEPL